MIYFDGVTEMKQIFGGEYLAILILMAAIISIVMIPVARKFVQIMQQSGYVGSEYIRWLRKRDNIYLTRLYMIVMLATLAYLCFTIALSSLQKEWVAYVGFIFYILFVLLYLKGEHKRKNRVPLSYTHRAIRLYLTFFFVFFLFSFLILFGVNILGYLFKNNQLFLAVRFSIACLTPIFVPLTVYLASAINKPFENTHNIKYIDRCKKTLAEAKGLIKIGITGSYGKTSVKEILNTILSERYKVLATPYSYNTPLGICKTVKRLDETYDIFLAEMGARQEGDIKELTLLVKPEYAIINGIIEHHLETFNSLTRIKRTKFELVKNMEQGVAVITCDNENALSLISENEIKNVKTIVAGVDTSKNPQVFATDIESGAFGSSFTLNFGTKKVKANTVLLGKHNVSNICLAAALAYEIGLEPDVIAAGISRVKAISHRLELKQSTPITIIDDSYNSNVNGIKAALEVVSSFGGRKIVVTPGLVELGKIEDYENYQFGKQLNSVADIAILVGKYGAQKVRDGLLSEDFDESKIFMVKDLFDAEKLLKEMTKEGDVVLFENDLPDKFA